MNNTTDWNKVWEDALAQIEIAVSKPNFNTWFKDTFVAKIEDGTVVIGVPNPFVRDWLQNKFHKLIFKTLRDMSDSVRAVEYSISRNEKRLCLLKQTTKTQ